MRWLDLFAIYRFIRTSGGSVRLAGEQLLEQPQFGSAAGQPPLQGWLAASLTALDGSELGAIQLFDKQDGAFTGDDEAVLVHLAQMTSAAVERTRLYQEQRIARWTVRSATPEEHPPTDVRVCCARSILDAPPSPDGAAHISARERSRAPRRLRLCVRARVTR